MFSRPLIIYRAVHNDESPQADQAGRGKNIVLSIEKDGVCLNLSIISTNLGHYYRLLLLSTFTFAFR